MKAEEIELTKFLNSKLNLDLINTKNEFCYYDSTNKNYIVEYKFRSKYYEQKLIQVDKLYSLLMIAEHQKKNPIYIVSDPEGIFIYNLKENKDYFLKSNIVVKKCPYRTEFTQNNKIDKYFYILTKEQLTKQL